MKTDTYFCENAAQTCRSAINLIIDLWPARYEAGEELRETLQELSRLRDFFTAATWEGEALEIRARQADAAAPVLDLDGELAKLAATDERIARAEAAANGRTREAKGLTN